MTEEFYERVRTAAGLDSESAARDATVAAMETLGERIGDRQAELLAESLPDEPADSLAGTTPDEAEGFPFDEFVDRVAARTDVEEFEALVRTRAVFDAVTELADESEVADARSQLPGEFDLAFDAGEIRGADEFLDAVRERTRLESTDDASAATAAVLETFGERLSAGEAADLATFLPPELKPSLTEEAEKEPPDFGVEEFVARVADREGVGEDVAESRARAVLAVLGETVGEREFRKARSQLPREYDALFDREAGGGDGDSGDGDGGGVERDGGSGEGVGSGGDEDGGAGGGRS